jgi:hypothetical protein
MKINFKNIAILALFVLTCCQYVSAQALPAIDLPAGWYPNFAVTHWQETRSNVTQTLNQNNITHTRNVAGELIWADQVTSFPVETNLLFNPADELERVTVYIHESTDAAIRHQNWFNTFTTHYGTDYVETNNAEMHKYVWSNENQVDIELIWFKQNPNFNIRAEFLRR